MSLHGPVLLSALDTTVAVYSCGCPSLTTNSVDSGWTDQASHYRWEGSITRWRNARVSPILSPLLSSLLQLTCESSPARVYNLRKSNPRLRRCLDWVNEGITFVIQLDATTKPLSKWSDELKNSHYIALIVFPGIHRHRTGMRPAAASLAMLTVSLRLAAVQVRIEQCTRLSWCLRDIIERLIREVGPRIPGSTRGNLPVEPASHPDTPEAVYRDLNRAPYRGESDSH